MEEKKIRFLVGVQSSSSVIWEEYFTKRDAVKALVGAQTIQKVAARTYVIRRKDSK